VVYHQLARMDAPTLTALQEQAALHLSRLNDL